MVSRSTGPLRKIMPAVAVGLSALLVGCGAGQVTQTDSIEPAVNGNRGNVGDIALRDVMVAYPDSGDYSAGDDAPLVLTIVNTGDSEDELVSVSSPAAPEVELIGVTALPGRTSLQVIVPDESVRESASAEPTESSVPEESITDPTEPGSTGDATTGTATEDSAPNTEESASLTETSEPEPSSPLEFGTMSIVLTDLVQDLPLGRNVPVTFVFANAGTITVNLPIASPATARQDPPETEEESGH